MPERISAGISKHVFMFVDTVIFSVEFWRPEGGLRQTDALVMYSG
ncbi:hypothetical protein [Levilactobacillus fujinensis]